MNKVRKEFWELNSLDATNETFEKEGYKVISFGAVKKELMAILKDTETAYKYQKWNNILEPNNIEMLNLENELKNIVFKESRGGKGFYSIGWENGESYLRYHSGIIYKWFKN